jgi:hypothetical protein
LLLSLRGRSCALGLVWALLAALGTAPGAAAQPFPVGPEFQVNGYTPLPQLNASVAADMDGDFVVVWESSGSFGDDNPGASVQGQRYASSGSAVGSQFQVNTYTTDFQGEPSIAADADGDFVVVWPSNGSFASDTSLHSIQGQRYDSAGSAVGGQFQVNTYITSLQINPSVAADADGDFVVVWESLGSPGGDTSGTSILGQRYASAGGAVGGEFQVNTYTTGAQSEPSVAAGAEGDFVVVWQSNGSSGGDTSLHSIQGQRYASSGSPVGSEFQVNTYTTSYQRFPSVAVEAGGGLVVVWESRGSFGSDTSQESVQSQRYDSAGNALGSEFQVNTHTTSYQRYPSVAAEPAGGFVVVWHGNGSSGSDTSNVSVHGQRYDSTGSAAGSEFQVNTYTISAQAEPSVAAGDDGFVVVWQSNGSSGSDTSGFSIQGQRYTTAPKVPSLSPAALAAAALLVCLAVGVALRRRV